MADDSGEKSWRDRGADWLFQQGVSTVLLVLIVVGAWYGIPTWIDKIETGHRSERQDYLSAVKEQQVTFNDALKTMITDGREQRKELLDTARAIRDGKSERPN